MANWHMRAGSNDGNTYEVIYHIPLPNVGNRVGFNYREALVNSKIGGTTVLIEGTAADQITTAEKTQVESGAIIEYVESVATNPGETGQSLKQRINTRFAELSDNAGPWMQKLKARLEYWGGIP